MRTPSLRGRVTVASLVSLTLAIAGVNAAVYLTLRVQLHSTLDDALAERVELTHNLADDLEPEDLADRLGALGIRTEIRTPRGEVFTAEPIAPRISRAFPPTPVVRADDLRTAQAALPDGNVATVSVFTGGVERSLRRLLMTQVAVSAVALALIALVIGRVSRTTLRPLDHMADVADQVAAGEHARRLAPNDPSTELGRTATAVDRMLDSLAEAIERANEAEARSRRFLADAAHQLRTPLTGLTTVASTLLAEPERSRDEELVFHLGSEATRIGHLTTELLQVARIDEGVRLTHTDVDLLDACRQEAQRAAALAPRLTIEVTGDDAAVVSADRRAVSDVLANLVDNARRHALGVVSLTVRSEGGIATVEVRDDGPGLSPADAQRAFQRFASLDGHGGSGLGLPIAQGLARAHGGDVAYEDGAFVVRLPTAHVVDDVRVG